MQVKAYTVSQITALIREQLEEKFTEVWVEAEVSDLRIPTSGHMYFILKDKNAQLRAILFKGSQRFVRLRPQDGMMVLARGKISVYEPRGEYQFICDYLEPRGSGALQMAFEQLKERLAKEGLFDESRKKPIPLWPKRIGIVTSITGAAIRDILNILNRRFTTVKVLINPVKVQGEGSAEEIARAIKELETQPDIDVIIVTRGGGSLEDLWAFNEETVARAIYNCSIPLISAVGHEIDFTISDFVSDLRAPTPSAAAELVIQNREYLQEQLATFEKRLLHLFSYKIQMEQMKLKAIINRRTFRDPWVIIRGYQEAVDDLELRFQRGLSYYIERVSERILHIVKMLHALHPMQQIRVLSSKNEEQARRLVDAIGFVIKYKKQEFSTLMMALDTLSPLKVLSRGYSLCLKLPDGRLIKHSAQLNVGDQVRLRFSKGGAICDVLERVENQDWNINKEKERINEKSHSS